MEECKRNERRDSLLEMNSNRSSWILVRASDGSLWDLILLSEKRSNDELGKRFDGDVGVGRRRVVGGVVVGFGEVLVRGSSSCESSDGVADSERHVGEFFVGWVSLRREKKRVGVSSVVRERDGRC